MQDAAISALEQGTQKRVSATNGVVNLARASTEHAARFIRNSTAGARSHHDEAEAGTGHSVTVVKPGFVSRLVSFLTCSPSSTTAAAA